MLTAEQVDVRFKRILHDRNQAASQYATSIDVISRRLLNLQEECSHQGIHLETTSICCHCGKYIWNKEDYKNG
jgi:hypothetical protein